MLQRVKKAFTLVELIVVVVVLGIIAALAIATFATVRENAACSVALRTAEGIARNADSIAAFGGATTDDDDVENAALEAFPSVADPEVVKVGNATAGSEAEGWIAGTNTVVIWTNGELGTATVTAGSPSAAEGSGACA